MWRINLRVRMLKGYLLCLLEGLLRFVGKVIWYHMFGIRWNYHSMCVTDNIVTYLEIMSICANIIAYLRKKCVISL